MHLTFGECSSILSLSELIEHADCVLPIENHSLADMVSRDEASKATPKRNGDAFFKMNGIASRLLTNLTRYTLDHNPTCTFYETSN